MTRRLMLLVCALALMPLAATPAFAGARVVAQRTSRARPGHIFLGYHLKPGHRYRVEVASRGHHSFTGFGTEIYQYVNNHTLHTGWKSLALSGVTPRSFTVNQPISNHLAGWSVAMNVQLTDARDLTVRLVDLGKHS